jgi:septal ring factor EnvC (AmiA/AmiB activator)
VVVRYGGKNGGDPFAKVKGMISDMIAKLEKEAEAEATEKAYCDEEMAKTSAKKEDLEDAIAELTAKIDKAAAASTALKEEVVELEKELVALAKEQAEMDEIRAEQLAAYKVAKKELTEGLAGVRKALDMLREYYGNDAASSFAQQPAKPETFEKSEGAGGSIIDILEVTESDFATNLAKEESQESDSAEAYEKQTQENKILKATKDQDVKYKTQEATALDKTISELTGDKETASTELAAVDEYFAKIKERCIAKPESYEERKARRDAEIEGLKEALSILESTDAFLQRERKGGKGKRAHFMASQ